MSRSAASALLTSCAFGRNSRAGCPKGLFIACRANDSAQSGTFILFAALTFSGGHALAELTTGALLLVVGAALSIIGLLFIPFLCVGVPLVIVGIILVVVEGGQVTKTPVYGYPGYAPYGPYPAYPPGPPPLQGPAAPAGGPQPPPAAGPNFCSNCGAALAPGLSFCPKCGARVSI